MRLYYCALPCFAAALTSCGGPREKDQEYIDVNCPKNIKITPSNLARDICEKLGLEAVHTLYESEEFIRDMKNKGFDIYKDRGDSNSEFRVLIGWNNPNRSVFRSYIISTDSKGYIKEIVADYSYPP